MDKQPMIELISPPPRAPRFDTAVSTSRVLTRALRRRTRQVMKWVKRSLAKPRTNRR